jgi:hypothetical protein
MRPLDGRRRPALSPLETAPPKAESNCACFLGNLFSGNQPKMQTIEKGHLEEVKFRVLNWD